MVLFFIVAVKRGLKSNYNAQFIYFAENIKAGPAILKIIYYKNFSSFRLTIELIFSCRLVLVSRDMITYF